MLTVVAILRIRAVAVHEFDCTALHFDLNAIILRSLNHCGIAFGVAGQLRHGAVLIIIPTARENLR